MAIIRDLSQLDALYGRADELSEAATVKVATRITPLYRKYLERAPFLALATVGPEGLDCSPRGDVPGFVRVAAPDTLLLPDRHGNNRVDSLRNIVRDPRVSLMFLIPGIGNAIRVNGRAQLDTDPALLASFAVDGRAPRSVMVIRVDQVYFQCARAIVRSGLWDPERRVDPASLPTPGEILAELSRGRVGGEDYDRTWPERAQQTLW
ncbi:pyridoxamine 5'-phosphate oxidase family protein [Pseudomonas mangiferae]|uniref:Pyridoxamine 5'-phosphate oxidase family protein n=1 Tax=Pseudomonas mangiferae TaxID=2593654 RepID=A0A553GYB4_9PSED|nr:pyridoxamine 5'-phosphate oxidase family protein [Pseudomonas mangiferae]TRX74480.1 pyridoxamine 5'-phosphate oxidase family protein [Pseudomonas mangiferae]